MGDRYFLKKTTDGVTLDFGGIAKGYCVDLLKSIAQQDKVDSALISISGNLMLIGNNNDTKTEWRVGVKHPRPKEQQYVCGLTISDRSVVTSGDYERFYKYDGLRINHVINPLTLCPVGIDYDNGYKQSNSFVTSATIVGESSLLCDAYSTAVMVLGATEGAAFLQSVGYSGIIFTSDYKYVVVGELSFISSQTAYKTEYEQL